MVLIDQKLTSMIDKSRQLDLPSKITLGRFLPLTPELETGIAANWTALLESRKSDLISRENFYYFVTNNPKLYTAAQVLKQITEMLAMDDPKDFLAENQKVTQNWLHLIVELHTRFSNGDQYILPPR
jgi:hypothetical protein